MFGLTGEEEGVSAYRPELTTDYAYETDEPAKKASYAAEVGQPPSQLPLSRQERLITDLHEVINQLTDRLDCVLTPLSGDITVPTDAEPKQIQSPLADELCTNNSEIQKEIVRLRIIVDRLEC